MKKLFTIFAVALCSTLAMAQANQYFWANGRFIMGNPIDQIDSITFGQLDDTDSITLYLPHTIKVVHDTIIKYVTIHDTINPCAVPDGAISGKFSVSATKQVYFSKGNLQFSTKDSIWQFAENQYDIIGYDNVKNGHMEWDYTYQTYCWIGDALGDKIDLFGWSADGNPLTKWGVNTSLNYLDYSGNFQDWGLLFDDADWYTLTAEEWDYVANERPNYESLRTYARVNGINGCILLPDNWNKPQEIKLSINVPAQMDSTMYRTINDFSVMQWNILQNAGAVFLPITGDRSLCKIYWIQIGADYWSSTIDNESQSKTFRCDQIKLSFSGKGNGRAVRLVQEVK